MGINAVHEQGTIHILSSNGPLLRLDTPKPGCYCAVSGLFLCVRARWVHELQGFLGRYTVGGCAASLKSAKNLYLSHRFFVKIRQIHSFFNVFRQNLQILCRNQARFAVTSLQVRSPGAQLTVRRENPLPAGRLPHEPRALAPKFPQSKR